MNQINYLPHGKQKIRVNISNNVWLAVMFGVPQGLILRPLLFNIFLADLFLIHSGTEIIVNSNTLYFPPKNVEGAF